MRDDFDPVVADRFKVLDDVPVPDTWSRVLDRLPAGESRSRVPFSDESLTMIDLEAPVPIEPRRHSPRRVGVAALVAAAAVIAIVVVATRDGAQNPADQPAPTVTVPSTTPPRALFDTPDEQLAPGAYFVDEVDGTPTARIFVTVGTGWTRFDDGSGLDKHGPGERSPLTLDDDIGRITFSRPDGVYLDACHLDDGFHPGPVTTLDGLVAALSEQDGWADVTAPTDISVDGYPGKTSNARHPPCARTAATF
jgi:hypothetical protein